MQTMEQDVTPSELEGVWEAIRGIREHLRTINGEGEEHSKRLALVENICTEIKNDLRWVKGLSGAILLAALGGLVTWIARGQ